MRPIAILYENEVWMAPLFGALDDLGAPYERVFLNELSFDPAGPAPQWSLAVNKGSPSSYLRGHARRIAVARELLPLLEQRGIQVVNGSRAFALETSKARQLLLLRQLGIRAPAARVITDPEQAPRAARELRFPVIVKPNIGGSGAHLRRFDSPEELTAGVAELDLGPDGTGLVQEFLESQDGTTRRVEFLGGEYLYAIRIASEGQDFKYVRRTSVSAESSESTTASSSVHEEAAGIDAFEAPGRSSTTCSASRASPSRRRGVETSSPRATACVVYDINACRTSHRRALARRLRSARALCRVARRACACRKARNGPRMSAATLRTADPWADTDVIDARAPRTNQAIVGTLSLLAFVTGWWPILGLLAAQLAIGLTFGAAGACPACSTSKSCSRVYGEGPIETAAASIRERVGRYLLGSATLAHALGFTTVGGDLAYRCRRSRCSRRPPNLRRFARSTGLVPASAGSSAGHQSSASTRGIGAGGRRARSSFSSRIRSAPTATRSSASSWQPAATSSPSTSHGDPSLRASTASHSSRPPSPSVPRA